MKYIKKVLDYRCKLKQNRKEENKMKNNNKNIQMTTEDQKEVEKINIHFKFRQNMNRIKSHFGF